MVVLTDENGNVLKPWEVHAGMWIISTRYSHNDQAVVCVMRERPAKVEPLPMSVFITEKRERRHA